MCGIAGFFNTEGQGPAEPHILQAMCQTMVHRGPSDEGLFIDGQVGLGMRRLSVIDLHTGHQPISNETKDIWVVCNGEIYNYQELAAWLVNRGHRLNTSSDTEVIVHLYEEFGDACVEKLRGMFSFALWDGPRSRLFMARDRLGVKPLYYFWNQRQFIFGSELKAILASPDVERDISPEGLHYYLRYSYIPDPLTIFLGVMKLPPGHTLSLKGTTLTVREYWDGSAPFPKLPSISEEDATLQLGRLLEDSVKLRLISDVPIGAFLSGGVDSSLVVALMAQQMTRPVSTFSIGFEIESFNELPHARQVARHLGTDHHELVVGPQGCDLIEKIVSHFDEPFGDASAIPTYHLSKLASQYVTVALSGDGGDELFAGYDRYRIDMQRSRFDRLPETARKLLGFASNLLPQGFAGKNLLRNVSLPPRQRYLENISYFGPRDLVRLLVPDLYVEFARAGHAESIMAAHFDRVSGRPWLSQLQYLDTKTYLPADVMTKVDRMSMAHSLEAREPLLDHELVEYVAGLPIQMKWRDGVSKYLLKRVAAKFLPEEIVSRKKQGFGVPLEYWFKESLREYVHDVLFDSRTRARGMFQQAYVEELVERYENGSGELAAHIWLLVIMETWCRLYIDGISSSCPPAPLICASTVRRTA